MNRRGFLGMLGAAIAGATLDPDRLLWEPGEKLISIPNDFGASTYLAHPDLFLTIEEFSRRYIEPAAEALRLEWECEQNDFYRRYCLDRF